jgi:hypothetical protein
MTAGVLRSWNSTQPAKIIALISGANHRRSKGKDVIAQLSMEQLMILVSRSFGLTSEKLSIVQFESSQLLKVEPEMIDPWISTCLRVHDTNAALRIVVPWLVEFLIVGSCKAAMMS